MASRASTQDEWPPDTLVQTFSLFDFQSKIRCQLVCTSWNQILQRPKHFGVRCECLEIRLHAGRTGQRLKLSSQHIAGPPSSQASLLFSFDAQEKYRLASFVHDWLTARLISMHSVHLQCPPKHRVTQHWMLPEVMLMLGHHTSVLPEIYLNAGQYWCTCPPSLGLLCTVRFAF